MDAAGVDMAMVCSLAQRIENDFIIDLQEALPGAASSASGRCMPQADDALDEIAPDAEAGIRGLKLHPSMHGYHVADHGLLDPVFRLCARARHGDPHQRARRCVLRALRDRGDREGSPRRADDHRAHGRGVERSGGDHRRRASTRTSTSRHRPR